MSLGEQQARSVPPWANMARGTRRSRAQETPRAAIHVVNLNGTGSEDLQRALVRSRSSEGTPVSEGSKFQDSHPNARQFFEDNLPGDTKNATKQLLKVALAFFGNSPTAIGAAARALLSIIGEIQGIDELSADWDELGQRYDRIASLLKLFPEASEIGERLVTALESQLTRLTADLEHHSMHTGELRLIGSVLVKLRAFIDHAAAKECIKSHNAWLTQILVEISIPAFSAKLPKEESHRGFQVNQNSLRDVDEAFSRINLSSSTNVLIKKNTVESTKKAFTDITIKETAGQFPPERVIAAFLVMVMSAMYVGMAY